MKALWKGNLSVALLSVPVKLYSAVRKRGVPLHLLHKACSTHLKYERYCPTCQKEVEWSDVTHGYEYEKDRYVIISDEELESLFREESRAIRIISFVPLEEIDPVYFDSTYYLAPEKDGLEAYLLLKKALQNKRRVGLLRFAMRGKEHIGILRPYQKVLAIHTLHFANEIASTDFITIPEEMEVSKEALALAEELVERFSARFDISEYHDRSTEALMELINQKISGGEVKVKPAREAERVVSLMEALKKSLSVTEPKTRKRKTAG